MSKELARLFIEANTDVNWLSVNKNGQTPIDLAMDNYKTKFLNFAEGFIDQLPPPEQKSYMLGVFDRNLQKPVDLTGFFIYNHK